MKKRKVITKKQYKKVLNEIENAMERWHLARDDDSETLEKINNSLFEINLLTFFNKKTIMEKETINLKCEKCGCDYKKPTIFKEYLITSKYNVFYKWSLMYCDKCRREKEMQSLKALPDVIKKLGENFKDL